ncbi:MAG: twin-arginine translocation signal domain-containing protein, partial [Chloroflexia bacterium]|nr:twin-arginine translocation signal domain-containing protein [Chloroflexia bacterium]
MKPTRPGQQSEFLSRRRFLRLAGALAAGTLAAACTPATPGPASLLPRLATWPAGRRAAVAFTFDWETAMGGLVHSRSIGDPNVDQDYLLRAQRMREGLATTMDIFAPLAIRATYYATGYNFLLGNREQRQFLGNPIFPWATQANGWTSDRWTTTPWFAD